MRSTAAVLSLILVTSTYAQIKTSQGLTLPTKMRTQGFVADYSLG